ncbi:FadR/GntR family transcriptional regulator [Bordetella genomosp. 12]|uniref:HTH gntR-type domain-containing protein n=1 Tax=Bordetella genomosp. 12 TaxID=463035 RepID=A0A261VCW7_9BORD|nr:FadR/GntR family transcriptional regulator [Bordetella genomosp. 12]OZI71611.1 hypothetical protein CAL22_17540 [Bordetella genomosp. 12]
MKFEQVSVPRLYRLIADRISAQITSGAFAPGTRLPAERDLAEQFDVARSTIREALIALEIGGIVEIRVGSGVYVKVESSQTGAAEPDVGQAAQAVPTAIGPYELIEARLLVEPEVAALAAQNATPDEREAIAAAHRVMEGHSHVNGDAMSDGAAHRAFHEAIAAGCSNMALAALVTQLWDMSEHSELSQRFSQHYVNDRVWAMACDEHDRILSAILAKDAVKARHAMMVHLLGIQARLSDELQNGPANLA